MGIADRISLPQEFYDKTSGMMLRVPLPAFMFARMVAAGSIAAELNTEGMASKLSDLRSYVSAGVQPPSLSDQMLMLGAVPGANAITVVNDLSAQGEGQTVRLNRPVFSAAGLTEAARIVSGNNAISVVPVDMTMGQATITIHLVTGPYDNANSRVAPYGIDAVVAKKSVHDLASLVGQNLYYDRTAYLDAVYSILFCNYANTNVRPGAYATDASMPTTGEVALDLATVWKAQEALETANVMTFEDGTYNLLISPKQMRQLRIDVMQSGVATFQQEKNPLFGDCERIGKVRIISCNTLQTDTASVSGQTIQRGVMHGPGYAGYANAMACEVRSSTDDNYGFAPKVIWAAYEGGGILDSRMAVGVRSI